MRCNISKIQLVELQKKFRTDVAIGEVLGINARTVRKLRKQWKIPNLWRKKPSKNKFIELQKKYVTDVAISKVLGVTSRTVSQWRKDWKIPVIGQKIIGPQSKNRMLSKARLIELQKTYKTNADIAEAAGVSCSVIRYWRERWNIPGDVGRGRRWS